MAQRYNPRSEFGQFLANFAGVPPCFPGTERIFDQLLPMNPPYRLKKQLGQHFLRDEDLARRIADLVSEDPPLPLLEVGPGAGALSQWLIQKPWPAFRALEVDQEKIDYLESRFGREKGYWVLGDILQVAPPFEGPFRIIGNFPYNISSPILFRVLEWEEQVRELVGMFQKEVAQRIAAGPGSRTYGILSVLIQTYYRVEYKMEVPPLAFDPPPKVDSAVLRLVNQDNPYGIRQRRQYRQLVKAAFNQRRKMLRNGLKGLLPPEKMDWPGLDRRAEQLSVEEFVHLFEYWQS